MEMVEAHKGIVIYEKRQIFYVVSAKADFQCRMAQRDVEAGMMEMLGFGQP
jgi:hypothetical protein